MLVKVPAGMKAHQLFLETKYTTKKGSASINMVPAPEVSANRIDAFPTPNSIEGTSIVLIAVSTAAKTRMYAGINNPQFLRSIKKPVRNQRAIPIMMGTPLG
jgi:hypothetical protein